MSIHPLDEMFLFRERFKEERLRLGFTAQSELGRKLLVSGKTVGKYETGHTSPGVEELFMFKAVGADLCYLLTGRRLPLSEQTQMAHAQHVVALIDTIVSLELAFDDAKLLNDLALRLGR